MTCLGCNNIEVKPVQLVDGRTVCNTCPDWRHECEARAIADLPTLSDRRAWLETIEHKRGKASADGLRTTMTALWAAKQR